MAGRGREYGCKDLAITLEGILKGAVGLVNLSGTERDPLALEDIGLVNDADRLNHIKCEACRCSGHNRPIGTQQGYYVCPQASQQPLSR